MGFLVFLALVCIAVIVGTIIETEHFKNLEEREAHFAKVPCITHKKISHHEVAQARLVTGSVVISIDKFKQILSSLRMLFGGELKAYAPLIERARREALLRMKEQSPGADMFVGVRLETSALSSNSQQGLGTVEVFAYGTALKFPVNKKPA